MVPVREMRVSVREGDEGFCVVSVRQGDEGFCEEGFCEGDEGFCAEGFCEGDEGFCEGLVLNGVGKWVEWCVSGR